MIDTISQSVPATVPTHVAVLADTLAGSTEHSSGLCRESYRASVEPIMPLMVACLDLGISVLTLGLAASEENKASAADQATLVADLTAMLESAAGELQRLGVAVYVKGSLSADDAAVSTRLCQLAASTQSNSRLVLNLVMSYDSRAEFAAALQRMRADEIEPGQVSEALLSAYLWPRSMPDPDLIIQTGGVLRLQNFLLWQAAYAEYYAAPVRWLEFDPGALQAAIAAYAGRERRFGAVLAT